MAPYILLDGPIFSGLCFRAMSLGCPIFLGPGVADRSDLGSNTEVKIGGWINGYEFRDIVLLEVKQRGTYGR